MAALQLQCMVRGASLSDMLVILLEAEAWSSGESGADLGTAFGLDRLKAEAALPMRLKALGVACERRGLPTVETVQKSNADQIYVVPFSLLVGDIWSDLRVRLARAGRRYLVYGLSLSSREFMQAARDGAHDVLQVEDDDVRWESALEEAARAQDLWWKLYGSRGGFGPNQLVGRSAAMSSLRDSVLRLGPTEATVLILGESGTGKERVAQALHESSHKEKFVVVNCAAIPRDLIEAELFGAERGAFTGSVKAKPGLVEEADGGTLFLDEIGELDIQLQPKLLRFIETRQARRVGATREYSCAVRLLAATNRELETEIVRGRFRADLYYRISEIILQIPPLRHRSDDVPDLTRRFLEDASVRFGKNFEDIEPGLIRRFQAYGWPGNVRELKQAVDRLVILFDGPVLRGSWWEAPRGPVEGGTNTGSANSDGWREGRHRMPSTGGGNGPGESIGSSGTEPLRRGGLNRREKLDRARRLLEESDYDLSWVAAELGIHPTTLYRWRKAGKV